MWYLYCVSIKPQATVIDPADVEGLKSALDENSVSSYSKGVSATYIILSFLNKISCQICSSKVDDVLTCCGVWQVTLFFTESPTNPFLRCVDIKLVSQLCHDKGALVCIDGTFASPLNQKALALGADLIVHSMTKFIGGHNDVCWLVFMDLDIYQIGASWVFGSDIYIFSGSWWLHQWFEKIDIRDSQYASCSWRHP